MNESRRDMFRQLAKTEPVKMLSKWLCGKLDTVIKAGEQFTSTPESAGLSLSAMPRRKGFNLPPITAPGSDDIDVASADPDNSANPSQDEVRMEEPP